MIFASIALAFTACKKKESTPSNTTSTTGSSSTTGGATTGGLGGADYGTFLSVYNTTDFGAGLVYKDSVVQVSFYDSPLSTHTTISAGTVSVNGTNLLPFSNTIYSATNQINLTQLNYQYTGNGTITAGSFSHTPMHPTYTGYNALPDTVNKAAGFTFNVTGITTINNPIYITISQGATPITKTVSTIPATITITSTELAGFSANNDFYIRLSLFNYSSVTLNSFKYGINANRTYVKSCYLKP
jgi:hypothetical protein